MSVRISSFPELPWHGVRTGALVASLILGSTSLATQAQDLDAIGVIEFAGDIVADDDVSAVAKVGNFLVIGADEAIGPNENKNFIQVLEPAGENRYTQHQDILLFEGDDKEEMDIEGIAAVDNVIYVIGSHSKKRSKTKPDKSYERNRKTFHEGKIKLEPARARLYRLTLASDGSLVADSKDQQSLKLVIESDPVLVVFSTIPSKENGVDIEGIAAEEDLDGEGEWLYAGLRGPVLREGYVPIVRFKFDDPVGTYQLRYVNLGGRGVRDITRVSNGFLILAGPVGDEPTTFQLYHWNGKDVVPGEGRDTDEIGRTKLLHNLSVPAEAKAEGLAVLEETSDGYDFVIVFDGIHGPLAQRYRIAKP